MARTERHRVKALDKRRSMLFSRLSPVLAKDMLALALLGCLIAIVIGYAAHNPSERIIVSMEQPTPQASLLNFYGVERNAIGAFRWSKPEATIALPVTAPATYRVTLTLANSSFAPQQRPVTILINDSPAGTFTLDDTVREYTVVGHLSARQWAGLAERALKIQIKTSPFIPENDPRPLGMIVANVAVIPLGQSDVAYAFLGAALLLIVSYIALRAVGLSTMVTVLVVGGMVVCYGALAVAERDTALFLAYQPVARPVAFLTLLLGFGALPILQRATVPRETAVPPLPVGQPRAKGASADAAIDQRLGMRLRAWSLYALPLVLVTSLGGGLRFYRYDRLSLWLDEGATIHFARLPWATVLGLHGWYDYHPPLYYTLVKLASRLVPEADAGRLVSVVTGTLTIVVAYALGARLLDRQAGLIAALTIALSPLHIWYSQTARMYVPSLLFVGLSYLALLAYYQTDGPTPRRWWAVLYGITTLLALYTVYSVVYALVPQALIIILIARKHGRHAGALGIATVAIVAGYLPWLPQIVGATRTIVGDQTTTLGRADYLGATPDRVANSLLSIIGIGGDFGNYTGGRPRPWDSWPAWQGLFLVTFGLIVSLGGVVFARRSRVGLFVALGLLIGTIAVGIGVSLISPGYAERTVIYAVLGWAMLVGAVGTVSIGRFSPWLRVVATACLGIALILPNFSLVALWRGADPPDFRGLVTDIAVASRFDQPISLASSWMPDFVAAYAPELQPHLTTDRDGQPVVATDPIAGAPGVWLAYADDPWEQGRIDSMRARLAAEGYTRVLHEFHRRQLYLDFYLQPQATIGSPLLVFNTTFAAPASDPAALPPGWQLPAAGFRFQSDAKTDRQLTLSNNGRGERVATIDVPLTTSGQGLLLLRFDAQTQLTGGGFGASLTCLAADGGYLDLASNEGVLTVPNDGDWHSGRTAALCPLGTVSVRIALSNAGTGDATFRRLILSLLVAPPADATP